MFPALLLLPGCLERPVVDVDPKTSNIFVNQVAVQRITATDLLFVIDNSTSMADKQRLLQEAVPKMVERLVAPDCVTRDSYGAVLARTPSSPTREGDPFCETGFTLEFQPLDDIHIGVITSSLGSHGQKSVCDTIGSKIEPKTGLPEGQDRNDRAHLIPLVRLPEGPLLDGAPLYTGLDPSQPFLNWSGQGAVNALNAQLANQVAAAGETGCGFEAPLEAFYRFLIEPRPYASLEVVEGNVVPSSMASPEVLDEAVLAQRAAFLRPSSLVAIVILTDENDCSVLEGGNYYPSAGKGHYVTESTRRMKRPTSSCEANPNDPCCDTCERRTPRPGCEAVFASSCGTAGEDIDLTTTDDDTRVRCFEQQRRFGIDLLYPVERYIDGLTRAMIPDTWTGAMVPNPLLVSAAGVTRPGEHVFLAGIVGVPWQDIATTESLQDPEKLEYLRTEDLERPVLGRTYNRWDVILGAPGRHPASRRCRQDPTDPSCGAPPVPPLDPFLVESIAARPLGAPHPIVETEQITDSSSWNQINGHEQRNEVDMVSGNRPDDLQYSCIFPLEPYGAAKSQEKCEEAKHACDCDPEGITKERPLCRRGPDAPFEPAQHWGKAYPSPRILEVLHGLRPSNAIVASICPKVATPGTSFGYTPALTALVDSFVGGLGQQCLPRSLEVRLDTGEVPCVVVEARTDASAPLDCTRGGNPNAGRTEVKASLRRIIEEEMARQGACAADETDLATSPRPRCSALSMCQIEQLIGQDAVACQEGEASASRAGYCYIDPARGIGKPELVANCAPNEKQNLRFVPNSTGERVATPTNETTLFVACLGETRDKASSAEAAP